MEQNILVIDLKMAYNTYMNITYKSNNNVIYSVNTMLFGVLSIDAKS